MVDVELKIDGKSAFEYESNTAPQVGEFLDITHENTNGLFKVVKVTHKVVKLKQEEHIIHYLEVAAKSVTA